MIVTPNKKLICHVCKKVIDKNSLTTPNDIFTRCNLIWNVSCNFDLCADHKNTRCAVYYHKKIDLFNIKRLNTNFTYWFNPPHDQIKQFVEHIFNLWRRSNVQIIGILPINTLCSNYASKYILPFAKYQPLTGRIKFLCPNCFEPTKLNSVNGYVTIFYDKR